MLANFSTINQMKKRISHEPEIIQWSAIQDLVKSSGSNVLNVIAPPVSPRRHLQSRPCMSRDFSEKFYIDLTGLRRAGGCSIKVQEQRRSPNSEQLAKNVTGCVFVPGRADKELGGGGGIVSSAAEQRRVLAEGRYWHVFPTCSSASCLGRTSSL